jgi:hypothetical protein
LHVVGVALFSFLREAKAEAEAEAEAEAGVEADIYTSCIDM